MDEKVLTQLSDLLNKRLAPLEHQLSTITSQLTSLTSKINTISSDLAEIRHDLGYENLKVIKRKGQVDLEEM
jgi:chaperonin cofactor prefoldin